MNKKLLGFLALILLLFWGMMNFNNALQKPLIQLFNSLKNNYVDTLQNIQNTIDEHFLQARTIQNLNQELQSCKKNTLLLKQYKQQLQSLEKLSDSNLSVDPRVQLVRAVSYAKFGDMNKIWLEVHDYNASKIYGLVYKESVAGIVIPKEGMPLALMIRDPKSSYAVRIGQAEAPGIAHGNNDKDIIVTYIPTWYNIKVGDEVTTSGLDNIFFEGLKVGKVISLTTSQGYQKAVVRPYYDHKALDYFYMIVKVK